MTPRDAIEQGLRLHRAGDLARAEAVYRAVLQVEPAEPDALFLLGTVALQVGRFDLAAQCTEQALHYRPNHAEAHVNLAHALMQLGRMEEAAVCCRSAVRLAPNLAETHAKLGDVLWRLRQLDEAVDCYRRALELKPSYAPAHINLGSVLKDLGKIDEAIVHYRKALASQPDFVEAHCNLAFSLIYDPRADADAILREARLWNERHAEPLAPARAVHENEPDPERRLRVGYVSRDFRDHGIGYFLVPLLANHDRSQVEVHCYAGALRPDAVTDRLRREADVWRSTAGVSDEGLARQVRDDRIDVLVDLNQHMAGCRLLVFARRPAPVQVAWLGYVGTTGLSAIGYRLTDPHFDPPGENDAHYAERSIRLPDTFWCYDASYNDGLEVNELPALAGAPFTFGSLNNFCKVNAGTLSRWASVLRAVPGSRLLLHAPTSRARDGVRSHFERESVAGDRVDFVDYQPRADYLRTYRRIDLGLDPLPYTGQTTSLDAAWMGVPTVTQIGSTVVGRGGLSVLRNLGLPELAAGTSEEFTDIAANLARDLPRLAALRAGMRARMEASSLMDAPRFARAMESAYRSMWRAWCATRTNS